MRLENLLAKNQVIFNLKSKNKEDAIVEMARQFGTDVISDYDIFIRDLFDRESLGHTALEDGVATPHSKSSAVIKPALLVAVSKEGIDFSQGEEDLSKVFFMIAVPEKEANLHIDILTKLSDVLDNREKLDGIINASSYEEIIKILDTEEESNVEIDHSKFVVAVTACPTGIAHTFMARDALVKAAKELGVEIKVETNGTDGRQNEITKEDLKRAKGVILAINKSVNEERFNGNQVIKVSAKDGINKAKELILDILDNKGSIANFEGSSTSQNSKNDKKNAYNHLMSGVSYMLPLVISGGILIALAFLFDSLTGHSNAGGNYGSTSAIAKTFMEIGKASFGLFIPVLAGYIAYSIGEKSALAAGLVAGALASSGGSGFLGALLGGLLAGYIVKYYSNSTSKLPNQFRGLNLILITPILSVFLTGIAMVFLLNPFVGIINTAMVDFLNSMNAGSRIVLGALLAGMMAVDMGGPVNKAAYLFGSGTLAATANSGGSAAMAAVMAGGMVPPLAIALATTLLFRNKYSKDEQDSGLSNYVMGLSFITEGAIPFAAANPLRVIPACIIGSATAGALTMFFNIKIPAPHGGILVMFLSTNFILYLLSVVIGSFVGAILLGILKKNNK